MWGQPWRSPFPFAASGVSWRLSPIGFAFSPKCIRQPPAKGKGPGSLGGCMLLLGGIGSEHPLGQGLWGVWGSCPSPWVMLSLSPLLLSDLTVKLWSGRRLPAGSN